MAKHEKYFGHAKYSIHLSFSNGGLKVGGVCYLFNFRPLSLVLIKKAHPGRLCKIQ